MRVWLAVLAPLVLAGHRTPAQTTSVDSIFIERLVPRTPKRIPMTKNRMLRSANTSVAARLQRLEQIGLDDAPSDSAAAVTLCGTSVVRSNVLEITVFTSSGSRRSTIPDTCATATPEMTAMFDGLRGAAWQLLRHGEL